jgi:hypothetical protein
MSMHRKSASYRTSIDHARIAHEFVAAGPRGRLDMLIGGINTPRQLSNRSIR